VCMAAWSSAVSMRGRGRGSRSARARSIYEAMAAIDNANDMRRGGKGEPLGSRVGLGRGERSLVCSRATPHVKHRCPMGKDGPHVRVIRDAGR
jgi:hypothetical protein